MEPERGQRVTVIDFSGDPHPRIALSGAQRGTDFLVVWVCRPEEWEAAQREGREPEGVPWPYEDVRAVEPAIV